MPFDVPSKATEDHLTNGPSRTREVAAVFLRLGLTAFGGPAAHISAMEDEIVQRRRWVTREEFVDLVSASNVIPGPNSTELAIHLGFRRAGWRGLVAAGLAFIGPTTAMVWALAMVYVRIGLRPEVSALLAGMQPVVLAVVVQALWRLGGTLLRTPFAIGIAVVCVAAVLAGTHELLVLAGAAVAGALLKTIRPTSAATGAPVMVGALQPESTAVDSATSAASAASAASSAAAVAASVTAQAVAIAGAPGAWAVTTTFLKIGSVLFGSGYVLLAFLRAEFVERNRWLTEGQLLDAIAIGQITPGPVFSSATFIGYLLAGHTGAAGATIGIFLPAFLFVAISGPLLRQIRRSPRASAALDGVNAGSLALLFAVALLMLKPVATSVPALGIFIVSLFALIRLRIGSGWMLLAGGAVGLMMTLWS